MVAGATDEIVQASALTAKDDDKIAGEVEQVVVGLATLVEAHDPEVVLLEVFEGADEIDDAGDAEMLCRAGSGFDGYGAERSRAALGEDDAIDTCAIGYAEQSAEVLRIFNAIEGKNQAGGACGQRTIQVFNGKKFLRTDECDHSLVGGSFRGVGELIARLLLYANADLAALGDQAGQTGIVTLTRYQDVIKAPLAGLERFLDWVQAVENFHEI
jgi:hypothetical protein